MRRTTRFSSDRGAVTAEFAIVLPAVLLVLGLVVGSILLSTQRLTLAAGAAEIARLEARGDEELAGARLAELGSSVTVARESRGALHCVVLGTRGGGGLLSALGAHAEACAVRITGEDRS